MNLSSKEIKIFQYKIKKFYKQHKRDLPWRKSINPYRTLISEIMLQQTQVSRVIKKFPEFIQIFPNFKQLASSPLRDILKVWSGMGYNRRAKYLKSIAEIITKKYHGQLPCTPDELKKLPGIGINTAGSITAFAYNKPVIFIETNIRSVYIHEFFSNKENIDDNKLIPLIKQTLDHKNPRDWYNALMDYGTLLKIKYKNPNKKSKHYIKQSTFKGSDREIRGMILKLLTTYEKLSEKKLLSEIKKEKIRVKKIINRLIDETLIQKIKQSYKIN